MVRKENTEQGVLVEGGGNFELLGLVVYTEPAPSGALDTSSLGSELALEGIKRAKIAGDLVKKRARGLERGIPEESSPPPFAWGARLVQKMLLLGEKGTSG